MHIVMQYHSKYLQLSFYQVWFLTTPKPQGMGALHALSQATARADIFALLTSP